MTPDAMVMYPWCLCQFQSSVLSHVFDSLCVSAFMFLFFFSIFSSSVAGCVMFRVPLVAQRSVPRLLEVGKDWLSVTVTRESLLQLRARLDCSTLNVEECQYLERIAVKQSRSLSWVLKHPNSECGSYHVVSGVECTPEDSAVKSIAREWVPALGSRRCGIYLFQVWSTVPLVSLCADAGCTPLAHRFWST